MNKYQRALLCLATMGSLLLPGRDAAASELGDFCWLTGTGQLMRFSVTQSGASHFTYTGIFSDADGDKFAISGHVEIENGTLVGSFSGSKTTASDFKTAIYRVTLNGNLAGFAEGIRQKYDRMTTYISTDYRTHTITPTSCP